MDDNSIEQVLRYANRRCDKKIMWLKPEQHLFPSVTAQGAFLDMDRSAPIHTATHVLARASRLAGIIGSLSIKALLADAAFDQANSGAEFTGTPAHVTELCIQQCLDSSDHSNRERVIAAYHKEHHENWIKSCEGYQEQETLVTSLGE